MCRIFEEVEGVENELMELKNHVVTQKKLVKELIDGKGSIISRGFVIWLVEY
jgi:hypothetical protein